MAFNKNSLVVCENQIMFLGIGFIYLHGIYGGFFSFMSIRLLCSVFRKEVKAIQKFIYLACGGVRYYWPIALKVVVLIVRSVQVK